MKRVIALFILLGLVGTASASTIAYWRFEGGTAGTSTVPLQMGRDWVDWGVVPNSGFSFGSGRVDLVITRLCLHPYFPHLRFTILRKITPHQKLLRPRR